MTKINSSAIGEECKKRVAEVVQSLEEEAKREEEAKEAKKRPPPPAKPPPPTSDDESQSSRDRDRRNCEKAEFDRNRWENLLPLDLEASVHFELGLSRIW